MGPQDGCWGSSGNSNHLLLLVSQSFTLVIVKLAAVQFMTFFSKENFLSLLLRCLIALLHHEAELM